MCVCCSGKRCLRLVVGGCDLGVYLAQRSRLRGSLRGSPRQWEMELSAAQSLPSTSVARSFGRVRRLGEGSLTRSAEAWVFLI